MNNILIAYNNFLKIYKKKIFLKNKFKTEKDKNIYWSYQLFKDLVNIVIKESSLSQTLINNKIKCRQLLNTIDNRLHYYENLNFNSFYYDFTRKIFLYKNLRNESKLLNIIIPECGICSFDFFICKILGFKNFILYDGDKSIKMSIKKIWGLSSSRNIKIYTIRSKDFFKINLTKQKYLLIEPDWCSQELKKILNNNNFFSYSKNIRVVRYSNAKNFKEHLDYIHKSDVEKFSKIIKNHVLHS